MTQEPDNWYAEDYVGHFADYNHLVERVQHSGSPTTLHDHSSDEDCTTGECEHWYQEDSDD